MSVGAFRSVLNDLVGCSESHLWSLVVLGVDVHLVDCRLVVHVKGDMIDLVDTGRFTHAIDADADLPDHDVEECDPDAPGTSAETAGGGVLKKLGVVRTKGIIDGTEVEVAWDHMKVSTPILSVRKLVKDGNDVYINKQGGYIMHLATGKKMRIFNFQGVYYLRMKITSGKRTSPEHRPDFHRPGL